MTNPTSLPPTEPDTTTHPVLLVDYDHLQPPFPFQGGDVTVLPDPDFTVGYNTHPVRISPDGVLYPDPDFDHRRFFYTGTVVPEVPLDGIERLRKRLGR